MIHYLAVWIFVLVQTFLSRCHHFWRVRLSQTRVPRWQHQDQMVAMTSCWIAVLYCTDFWWLHQSISYFVSWRIMGKAKKQKPSVKLNKVPFEVQLSDAVVQKNRNKVRLRQDEEEKVHGGLTNLGNIPFQITIWDQSLSLKVAFHQYHESIEPMN